MARKGYTGVSFPNELIKEVDLVIRSNKRGYRTRPDFIKQAIRQLLDELKK